MIDGLVIDNFAGGGGASFELERAFGRPVDFAINHSREAVALHQANHPETHHYCEDVWSVDPREVTRGRDVALAWFSPDCTHYSRAKSGRPRAKQIRGLAWVALRWAALTRPRLIMLENVGEFAEWGPLTRSGRPCPIRKRETFARWTHQLRSLGYTVEHNLLRACDYGAPTIRQRLFLVARRDGLPVVWPQPGQMMHGAASLAAADHVDWSVACRSVFARTPALVEATMRRVALGVKRFVLDAEAPYLRPGNGLEAAFVVKHFGGMVGTEVTNPFPTILSRGAQNQLVVVKLAPAGDAPGWHARRSRALLARHAGVAEPTLAIAGARYRVADIGMRLMTPRELYRLQGFPDSYRIDADFDGKPLTVTAQVRMCGNSVSPPPAHALITANLNHQAARMAA